MDIDRVKLTKDIGEAIGIDLLSLRSFDLKVEKKPIGGLSIKLHLFDDTAPDVAKKLADAFAARYAPEKPAPQGAATPAAPTPVPP